MPEVSSYDQGTDTLPCFKFNEDICPREAYPRSKQDQTVTILKAMHKCWH